MGLFKKYVTCIIAFFIPFHSTFVTFVTLCRFYSGVSLSYSQGIERYIWFLQGNKISKEVVNTRTLKQNFIFRHICMYKQPILTKQWNYNIFIFCRFFRRFVFSDFTQKNVFCSRKWRGGEAGVPMHSQCLQP